MLLFPRCRSAGHGHQLHIGGVRHHEDRLDAGMLLPAGVEAAELGAQGGEEPGGLVQAEHGEEEESLAGAEHCIHAGERDEGRGEGGGAEGGREDTGEGVEDGGEHGQGETEEEEGVAEDLEAGEGGVGGPAEEEEAEEGGEESEEVDRHRKVLLVGAVAAEAVGDVISL